jgi:uncharacterized protein YrzB (UPF0473 family)
MSEEIMTPESGEEEYVDVYTLTDEETGDELQFEVLAEADIDGAHYFAMIPLEEEQDGEEIGFIVLQAIEENGETTFATIDDEETFDRVAEFFEDLFFNEVDCD